METGRCLNCGHEQIIVEEKIFYDELGKHTICEECESSYDIE